MPIPRSGLLLLIFSVPLFAAPPVSNAQLKAAADAAKPEAIELLKTLVNIDSGSRDPEGIAKVDSVLIDRFKALGADVRTVPSETPGLGQLVVATLSGRGKGRILIVVHADTVFGQGVAAQRPFRIEGSRGHGPGIIDEKSGDVCAIEALTILKQAGFDNFARITVLVDSSEEIGSLSCRKLIASLAKESDVEFNMEPGEGTVTTWRKGSANVEITVHGRAAHSGVEPQMGRNAATELIHELAAIDSMFPHSGDGTTVNLTLMKAGERANIIPDLATATLNVRFRKSSDLDEVLTRIGSAVKQTSVPDTTATVADDINFPPFLEDAKVDSIAAKAKSIYAELGQTLAFRGSGGASESALAQAQGIPAIDGLGFDGGDAHTDHEFLDVSTIPARIYLTARLIEELGPTGR